MRAAEGFSIFTEYMVKERRCQVFKEQQQIDQKLMGEDPRLERPRQVMDLVDQVMKFHKIRERHANQVWACLGACRGLGRHH